MVWIFRLIQEVFDLVQETPILPLSPGKSP